MKIPETVNPSFNNAVRYLTETYEVIWLDGPALQINTKPKNVKSKWDWSVHMDYLISFLEIGRRNDWIQLHVDGQGRIAFIRFNIPIPENCIRKDKYLWSNEEMIR